MAALRREWREQDADRCARHAANAPRPSRRRTRRGDPRSRSSRSSLDALLTRAESRASSAAARGAAAAVLPRGRTLAGPAIASRPDAVAGLVSPMCDRGDDDDDDAPSPKAGDPSGSTWRRHPAGTDPMAAAPVERRGGSRGRAVDRHRARGRSERAGGVSGFHSGVSARRRTQRGRQRVQHPGDGEPQALGAAAGNDAAQVICTHLSHRHLDELAAALAKGHPGGGGGGGGATRERRGRE